MRKSVIQPICVCISLQMERSQSSSAVKFSTFNTTIVEKQKQTQFWNVQVKNEFLNGQDTVETVNKI